MSSVLIREAVLEDVPLILHFVRELAIYEKAAHEVVATEEDIRAALFAANAIARALVCEKEGRPIGFALYFFNYSTWLGRRGLYLEDLYVTPAERGSGGGKALLKHLAQIAVKEGCGRFEWNVLDWNEPSIQFYESLGAEAMKEWIGYRLTGQALLDLAKPDNN